MGDQRPLCRLSPSLRQQHASHDQQHENGTLQNCLTTSHCASPPAARVIQVSCTTQHQPNPGRSGDSGFSSGGPRPWSRRASTRPATASAQARKDQAATRGRRALSHWVLARSTLHRGSLSHSCPSAWTHRAPTFPIPRTCRTSGRLVKRSFTGTATRAPASSLREPVTSVMVAQSTVHVTRASSSVLPAKHFPSASG